jgi:hypothetical protein
MWRGWTVALTRLAALLPVVLAAVLPSHALVVVCRFGGVMDVESCCPAEHRDEAAVIEATVHDEPCCALVAKDFAPPASDLQGDLVQAVPPTAVQVVVATVPPPPQRFRLVRSVIPPPLGPPIILVKQSFLI